MPARPMIRYLAAATLARGADSGAAVGLVLLAVGVRPALPNAIAVGGILAASLTAPHVLGPWVANRLDRARDGRRFLALAFGVFAVALAVAALSLGHLPVPLVVLAVAIAGAAGPLLTGGMSSRVPGLCGPNALAQRRGEGWDSLSYGLASTVGPAAVAALAAATDAVTALLVLCAAVLVAATITLTLPPDPVAEAAEHGPTPSVRSVLTLVLRHGPLRRVNVGTMLTAFGLGAMAVIAVVLATDLTGRPGAGALLMAMFGAGSLFGALIVTAFPVRGEPEIRTTQTIALAGLALASCAVAPSYPVALGLFALVGLANAPFVTATFAARTTYAPPEARAQVFVTMASLKVAAAASGTALAGVLTLLGPRGLTVAAGAAIVAGAVYTVVDRRLSA